MIVRESVPLASLSTLRVGGLARYVCEAASEADVREALAFATERALPWRVLGEGSNILPSDEGFSGVIILMKSRGIEETAREGGVLLQVAAGESWDGFVEYASERSLWGVENLAGIPGTVGASPVQNIGAYGTEVRETIRSVTVLNTTTGAIEEIATEACGFGYRESRFKHDPSRIILSVTYELSTAALPRIGYADLARAKEAGVPMDTAMEIVSAVREIRARKFPDLRVYGTAGSFFKNPVLPVRAFETMQETYPDVPSYPATDGIKVPLAFVLDKVLNLRGYQKGNVALFEKQPLVLVSHAGATASEIDAFAHEIAQKVFDATGITIDREVRTFP